MVAKQKDMKIPTKLIPKCAVCGASITMNLRCDDSFIQDKGWYEAAERYENFIRRLGGIYTLFLELDVGMNTPVIIKYPFWQMTAKNPKAVYACVNRGEVYCPREIANQAICIDEYIEAVFYALTQDGV